MKRFLFPSFIGIAMLIPAAASAQSGLDRQQIMSACMSDYQRFCLGVRPGGGRILACLGENAAELAPDCAAIVVAGMQCVEDYKRLCAGVSPQNGELKRCMESNIANLSEGCAKMVAAGMAPAR